MRVAFDDVQVEYRPVACGKFLDQLRQCFGSQVAQDHFFRLEGVCNFIQFKRKSSSFLFSEILQGRIDHHPAEPAPQGTGTFVLVNVGEYPDETVLQHILCFRTIFGITQANAEKGNLVRIVQLSLGFSVFPDTAVNKMLLFALQLSGSLVTVSF